MYSSTPISGSSVEHRRHMRRFGYLSIAVALMVATIVLAQDPAAGGHRARGARGPAAPPATGPIADMVTKITDAINKQDAAALTKLVSSDAVLIDEDGHFDPVNMWITKLTSTGAKTMTVMGGRGL